MKRIPLTQGQFAIVDDKDYEWLNKYKWNASETYNCYYARRTSRGILMHRVVMKAKKGQQIDHINRNSLDNRKVNLRFCTSSQNHMNEKKRCGRNGKQPTSQYKGVFRFENRWRAQIKINRKQIHLGSFQSEIKAALAYDEAVCIYFGEYGRLNFPKECVK